LDDRRNDESSLSHFPLEAPVKIRLGEMGGSVADPWKGESNPGVKSMVRKKTRSRAKKCAFSESTGLALSEKGNVDPFAVQEGEMCENGDIFDEKTSCWRVAKGKIGGILERMLDGNQAGRAPRWCDDS